jgi:hypothetical protein
MGGNILRDILLVLADPAVLHDGILGSAMSAAPQSNSSQKRSARHPRGRRAISTAGPISIPW